jgi:uncharacterized protein with FMN-binding domain/polyferredoxin
VKKGVINMAKKIKKTQVLRHVIQLILFLLLPGLYAMTFSELKTVYVMIIGGNFNFIQALPNLVEFVAVMLLTIVMGRWFCGWICSFGAYNDLIYFISKKVFKSKFKVNEKVDSILKNVKYVVLIFIIIVSWTMGSNILESTSPWDAFGQITNLSTIFSSLLIGLILLGLITIGAFFVERFFCRYLCPLGAVFAIISRLGITKINKPKADCGKCRACTNNCSMGLKLYKVNGARGGDCINCLNCTEVCPRNNANANILGQDLNATLTGSVAMATMLGVYGLTNFGVDALTKSGIISNDSAISSNVTSDSSASDNASSKYKDGTYIGTGTGFAGGTTKISVTITDGKIAKIETLSDGDDPQYFNRASGTITKEIISKQSTEVNTVSGATFSSKGIISAVKDALNQASNSSSNSDTSNNSSGTKDEAITSNSAENPQSATSAPTVNPKSTTADPKANAGSTSSTNSATSNNSGTNSSTTTSAPTINQSNKTQAPTVNQGSTSSSSTASQSTNTSTASKGKYKDGTYTGSGSGFGGTTNISVTISGGKITGIQTLSEQDTSQYYNRAIGTLKNSIISKQSASVNTVSGATYSSKGIIEAVQNALSQAI